MKVLKKFTDQGRLARTAAYDRLFDGRVWQVTPGDLKLPSLSKLQMTLHFAAKSRGVVVKTQRVGGVLEVQKIGKREVKRGT